MNINEILLNIAFYLFALIGLFSALMVATSTNIVRTAFSLMGVLFSFAAIYGLIRADFLFAAQILIYVGGILVLIIFAIMLTHKISDVKLSNESSVSPIAVFAAPVMFLILLVVIMSVVEFITVEPKNVPLTDLIGAGLMSDFLLPFEILSVLLLACLIGAVYLARKEIKE